MTYKEIEELCKKGKIGIIPGWKGYLKYDYGILKLYFSNEDYRNYNLEDIYNRTDLYYII